MPKFRKKPVEVEAVQLRRDTWSEMCDHAGVGKLKDGKPTGCYVGKDGHPLPEDESSDEMGLLIPTLEGLMVARQNDWIIRGVNGELYPCKPDIFAATYTPMTRQTVGFLVSETKTGIAIALSRTIREGYKSFCDLIAFKLTRKPTNLFVG